MIIRSISEAVLFLKPRRYILAFTGNRVSLALMLALMILLPACAEINNDIEKKAIDLQPNAAGNNSSLYQIYDTLRSKDYVDLTHSFGPGIPHWEGFPNETVETIFDYNTSGFFAQEFKHVGQWGTHVDPPAHFHKGMRTVDQIDVKEMVLPLVVIDIHDKAAQNPDYQASMDDVRAWQSRHGRVPEGSFVALRTDWSKRWPNMTAMLNKDANGTAHYPGWSMEVLKYLYEDCNITASGHETTDTDPGFQASRDNYALESYVLGRDHYQIELLADLDQVPEYGALMVVTFPKPEGGSGFPARAFAILP